MWRSRRKEALFEAGRNEVVMAATYDRVFIDLFKGLIPFADRRWDADRKVWLFSPVYLDRVTVLAASLDFDCSITKPLATAASATAVTGRIIAQINYLGNIRHRRNGALTASGMDERGEWLYVIPWTVIAGWLDIGIAPMNVANLYDRLSVAPTATADELKRAFRSLVRVWHPDVSSHPQATDAFRAVQEAYDVLADGRTRNRYDVALKLQGQVGAQTSTWTEIVWIPPDYLRCGLFDVEVETVLGKLYVAQIYGHDDIVNSAGSVMTARWDTELGAPVYGWK